VRFVNSFEVQAEPDRVYALLLDVAEVIPCVPGAELTEVVDEDTYRGRVKIKIGAIVMAYNGIATIVDRDDAARSATLKAEGREANGTGAATMQATLGVTPNGSGSAVSIATDLTITGRAAQFGRGIMTDISKRLIDQMASCIQTKLERTTEQPAGDGSEPAAPASDDVKPSGAAPVNAVALLFSVLRERIARLFHRRRHADPTSRESESSASTRAPTRR
jgi:carbon monoxide dehydrogenase subunit G